MGTVQDTGRPPPAGPVPRQAGVLGRPIAHSLSPVLHRAAYTALGLDWTYEAIDCGVEELPAVLAARAGWAGFSATMPLKRALVDLASTARSRAAATGAANTLLPDGAGGWIADNTDVLGVLGALREHALAPTTVTVLGAGGTAQAVLAALVEAGVATCTFVVRDPTRAAPLVATARRLGVPIRAVNVELLTDELDASLVVSTLPPGAADRFAGHGWRPGQAVLDVVYSPWPTLLANSAGRAGATLVSGALMLLHQAAAQVELMTGRPAPLDAMRSALRVAAPGCGA